MKLALINCYFGSLPNYFELWMQSCAANPQVNFILITDAHLPTTAASNVLVINTTWNALIEHINSKFDFEISIQSPYKLTDFKPAYGYIFEDLLKSYDYWGYCDIDLIFGNLIKFIKKPINEEFEKIYRLGHLTIYKNNERMRMLFKESGAAFSYKEVFSNPELYSFDEHAGQMLIAKEQKIKQYYHEDMADISCRIKRMTASRQNNYIYQVFYYENGAVYRAYITNNKVSVDEYVYIHIQKRAYQEPILTDNFFILSNSFRKKKPGIPSIENIKHLSEFESHEIDKKQLRAFHKQKIKDFLKSSAQEKRIWIKIKIAEKQFNQ